LQTQAQSNTLPQKKNYNSNHEIILTHRQHNSEEPCARKTVGCGSSIRKARSRQFFCVQHQRQILRIM